MTTAPIPNILTTRAQSFTIDGTDFANQAASATIKGSPGKDRMLGEVAPENEYAIEITAGQDLTVQSLWYLMFTRVNEQVSVVLKPYGNDDEPSETQPWVSVNAWVAEPDGDLIGGAADTSTTTKRMFSVSWACDRPVLITTTGA